MEKETMSRAEVFLNQYRQLEAAISSEYNLQNSESALGFLMRRPEYRSIKAELDYCREVRNLLTHHPKLNKQFMVEPSEEMVALLEQTIDKIKNPTRAKHIWVPRSRVTCRELEDCVYPAMVKMREYGYTHIPILRHDVVVGVFSDNTLLHYLIDDGTLDKEMKFSALEKYLPLEQHTQESFRFISRNTLLSDIEDIFSEGSKNKDRVGLIFVTKTGKATEPLLGIISAWDVAGAE